MNAVTSSVLLHVMEMQDAMQNIFMVMFALFAQYVIQTMQPCMC